MTDEKMIEKTLNEEIKPSICMKCGKEYFVGSFDNLVKAIEKDYNNG
jgi:uncharacterized protein with PIN domain